MTSYTQNVRRWTSINKLYSLYAIHMYIYTSKQVIKGYTKLSIYIKLIMDIQQQMNIV